MRCPFPARAAAFEILLRVEREDSYAAELLHSASLAKLSSRDHGLATELVMGVLRWQSLLDRRLAAASSQKIERLDGEVLAALRLGVYQLQFLSRVPARAAIFESVELVKAARKRSAASFVNAVLRKIAGAGAEDIFAKIGKSPDSIVLAENAAHPPWLVARWADTMDERRRGRSAPMTRRCRPPPFTFMAIDRMTLNLATINLETISRKPNRRRRRTARAGSTAIGGATHYCGRRDRNTRLSGRPYLHSGRSFATGRVAGQWWRIDSGLLCRSRQQDRLTRAAQPARQSVCHRVASSPRALAAEPQSLAERSRNRGGRASFAFLTRLRPHPGRRSLFRHRHAGPQPGNQVAAQTRRPSRSSVAAGRHPEVRACPTCDSRPACLFHVFDGTLKKTKRWWKLRSMPRRNSRWSIARENWSNCSSPAKCAGRISRRFWLDPI